MMLSRLTKVLPPTPYRAAQQHSTIPYQDYLKQLQLAKVSHQGNHPHTFPWGYPMNTYKLAEVDADITATLKDSSLNNIGDPHNQNSYFTNHTLTQEKQLLTHLTAPFETPSHRSWSYITTGGTEGNMAGIHYGLNYLKSTLPPIAIYSKDAHYSIPKIVAQNRLPSLIVQSQDNGAWDLGHFEELAKSIHGACLLLPTLGTTVTGANDDWIGINRLRQHYLPNSWLHLDMAFHGGFWRHTNQPHPTLSQPTAPFDLTSIDSGSISGHKWFGGDPKGVFMLSDAYSQAATLDVDYLNLKDKAITGSRSGFNAPWWMARLLQLNWKDEYMRTNDLKNYMLSCFQNRGISAWSNPNSLTIIIPKPSADFCKQMQLATATHNDEDIAHIIVLPHHTQESIEDFIEAYIRDTCKNTC